MSTSLFIAVTGYAILILLCFWKIDTSLQEILKELKKGVQRGN